MPETVQVYAADQSTVIKKSVTTYNLSSNYTDRRIIGLPSEVKSWGWNDLTSSLEYVSKVTVNYDENGYSGTGQSVSPTHHDDTSFGTGFAYRGNTTSTTRWDVTADTNSNLAVTSSVIYNTAGSPIKQTDPRGRVVQIGYSDNFNSAGNPSTYAYPTVLTDPAATVLGDAAHSSFVKYRYDIGANVEATSPAPAGNTYGKTSKRIFDSVGRLERNSVYINTTEQTYVRYEYPSSGTQSKTYSTITDTNSNGVGDSADEVLTESFFDGAGRVRQSRVPHTFNTDGTTATWAATMTEYDILGRVKRQSVPTEVDSSWTAAGNDAARGYLWTYQKYDWKGRVVRRINTDGIDQTTLNDSDVLISYEGCGCAGGQVTTIQGELVPRTDTTGNARRTQKIYEDILGRQFKTESYNWDGSTVYSTVVNSYNGRDQAVLTRQYAGSTTSSTYQDTTASFDGHGRLASSHKPEQRDASNNLTYTTYSYNPDDSIHTVTDGRGAVTTYTYGYQDDSSSTEKRGLLTKVAYSVPTGSGITDPSDVTYTYDNLGNRTQMTDGMGNTVYSYDSLSEMTSETRQFNDTLANAPMSSNRFQIGYTYSISGQLKSYTDPWSKEIDYGTDKLGRLNQITGISFAGVTSYASNTSYRAWGALKHVDYGNSYQMDETFNNRLQPATYKVDNPSDSSNAMFDKTYEYYKDGALKVADENDNLFSSTISGVTYTSRMYDRYFSYDNLGRVYEAKSGSEATGTPETNYKRLPYRDTYNFNALNNLNDGNLLRWDADYSGFSYSFVNNRANGFAYDNDGHQTSGENTNLVFNAASQMSKSYSEGRYEVQLDNDGNGKQVKRSVRYWNDGTSTWGGWDYRYFIYSSVLGRNISEADSTGSKKRTYVSAGGSIVAIQGVNPSDPNYPSDGVGWIYDDPSGLSSRSYGTQASGSEHLNDPEERDPLGTNVGQWNPFRNSTGVPPKPGLTGDNIVPFDYSDGEAGCELDGIAESCSYALDLLANGSAQLCPNNDCGPRVGTYHGILGDKTFLTFNYNTRDGFGIPESIRNLAASEDRMGMYGSLESGGLGGLDCPTGQEPKTDPTTRETVCVDIITATVSTQYMPDFIIDWRFFLHRSPFGDFRDFGPQLRAVPEPAEPKTIDCNPTLVQRILGMNGTLQIGLHGTALYGIGGVTGGFGIALDEKGNISGYSEFGAGVGGGANVAGGVNLMRSNARDVRDLRKFFNTASVGGGDGIDIAGNLSTGQARDGSSVVNWGILAGGGAGGGFFGGRTYTAVSDPYNIWELLDKHGRRCSQQ